MFKLAWSKNGTPNTLSGASDTITISDQTSTKFNIFLSHQINNGSGIQGTGRSGYGSVDSGNNYARRQSFNGAADATATSQSYAFLAGAGSYTTTDAFTIGYFINIQTEEKLFIAFTVDAQPAASLAPDRIEAVGKWANTSNQITEIDFDSTSGNFGTNSILKIWGSD